MNRKKKIIIFLLLFLSSLLFAEINEEVIKTADDLRSRFLSDIRIEKQLLLFITIVIISFGALISFIPTVKFKRAKLITQVLGMIITISMGVSTAFFDADYKTYKRVYFKINTQIDDFRDQYEYMDLSNDQIKDRYISDITDLKEKCDDIRNILYPVNQLFIVEGKPRAGFLYAQELDIKQIPKWFDKQSESNKGFMLAKDDNKNLEKAYDAALYSSIKMFEDTIRTTFITTLNAHGPTLRPQKVDSIISVIGKSMSKRWERNLVNDWFSYDKMDSNFTYFIRVYIDTKILREIYYNSVDDILDKEVSDIIWSNIQDKFTKPVSGKKKR